MLEFSLPLYEPVFIFTLVLFIILFTPLLLRRLRIPALIGLITAGIIVGPNGLNLLLRDTSIVLFGTVGLLYIMFLAALEMDLAEFKQNRMRSLVFGILTFSIPQALGTLVGYYVLDYNWISSMLLASMFASHTLLAYPIASKLGIARSEAVAVTVGGTMVTTVVSLLILAVIAGSTQGDLGVAFWLRLVVLTALFVIIVLWIMPKIGRWFFRYGRADGTGQYIFVLAVVFISSSLAMLAGLEAIIGAFLAGLVLNQLVPRTSPLMNRIEFMGNTLFIPFFLISVGMLVDLRVLFQGSEALKVALVMVVVATVTKWLAAFLTQKLYGYSTAERDVIFGLSNAQAAATLAAVLIGFNMGLFNEHVLNGTILMILVTCLISTLVVEKAGRELALQESTQVPAETIVERILVPVANPATIELLVDLAVMIKSPHSQEPLYALMVVRDNEQTQQRILAAHKTLERAIHHAAATENTVEVVSRIDLNVANGIVRAIRELMITEVVIGWNAQVGAREWIFGSVLDNLLHQSRKMILVCRLAYALNVTETIIVIVPPHSEREVGFSRWLKTVQTLAKQTGANLKFWGNAASLGPITMMNKQAKTPLEATYTVFHGWEDLRSMEKEVGPNDLLIIVSARRGSLSHHRFLDSMPRRVALTFPETSFVFIYPEQSPLNLSSGTRLADEVSDSLLQTGD